MNGFMEGDIGMTIEICCMDMLDALISKNIDIIRELGDKAYIQQYIMRRELGKPYLNIKTCPFCGAKL